MNLEKFSELRGKTAVLTGASRGIGAATALALARCGVRVGMIARDQAALQKLQLEIGDLGGEAMALPCDISNWEQVSQAIENCATQFSDIDILINNAGLIEPISPLSESDPSAWATVMDVNVNGVYYGIRAVLPMMRRAGKGVIINISSGAAHNVLEGWSHYCASKAAVYSLTKSVHLENADAGIRVLGLSPGTVATHMQVAIKASGINPVSQLDPSVHIPPEWVAQALCWLACDEARNFDGDDVSLRDDAIRDGAGLPRA